MSRFDRKEPFVSFRPCECGDPACPAHEGRDEHRNRRGEIKLYRIDMEDRYGSWYCDACAEDALDSGVFSTERNF